MTAMGQLAKVSNSIAYNQLLTPRSPCVNQCEEPLSARESNRVRKQPSQSQRIVRLSNNSSVNEELEPGKQDGWLQENSCASLEALSDETDE